MSKNKTINIYLDKEDRKKIDNIKVKYQLSLTTICDILCMVTLKVFLNTKNEELIDKLRNSYIYKNGKKTSIKTPKLLQENNLLQKETNKSRFTTNVIKIYLYHDIKKYIEDDKIVNQYYNECNEKMTKTIDEFWNYNEHIRLQRRMLKENKDYFRKALDQI